MKTRAAVLRKAPGQWEVTEVDLADPGPGEIQVRMVVAGLCHSDDHLATGDLPVGRYPVAGGHEGAGIVSAVGPGVTEFAEGDHVGILCVAGCGRCRWCAMGSQNLCELNGELLSGGTPEDAARFRMSIEGQPVGQMVAVSTFSEYTTVSLASAMKLPDDIPLDVAALVSCGVTTGWGAAVNSVGTQPGHTIMVVGIGGVGINAVQGARHAGASVVIAVDPNGYKTARAEEFGATHRAASIAEGAEIARSHTDGQGADGVVVTIGVVHPPDVSEAFGAIRKGGTVAVVGLASLSEREPLDISLAELTFFQKKLVGSLYGAASPRYSVTRLLDLYRSGELKLHELITATYTLDEINVGYADMHAGKNLRGVVLFD